MFKRIFAVLTLCSLFLFSGCRETRSEASRSGSSPLAAERFDVTPPFFKVTDKNTGAAVYMLGSMHVGKAGAVYPEKMYKALDESGTLAVELDTQALQSNKDEMNAALQVLLCEKGKTAADYMGDDYADIKKEFRKKGIYNAVYEAYIPSMWTSLWSNTAVKECGYNSDLGTDNLLISYAKERGKKIDEIESAKEQYQVQAESSAALQVYILKETVALSAEENQEEFDELYDAWKSADTDKLKEMVSEEDGEVSEELKADYDSYYEMMYTLRQKKMADYVLDRLKNGSDGGVTFMVVGAMHYAAPPSILDILEENGYEIENLNA